MGLSLLQERCSDHHGYEKFLAGVWFDQRSPSNGLADVSASRILCIQPKKSVGNWASKLCVRLQQEAPAEICYRRMSSSCVTSSYCCTPFGSRAHTHRSATASAVMHRPGSATLHSSWSGSCHQAQHWPIELSRKRANSRNPGALTTIDDDLHSATEIAHCRLRTESKKSARGLHSRRTKHPSSRPPKVSTRRVGNAFDRIFTSQEEAIG